MFCVCRHPCILLWARGAALGRVHGHPSQDAVAGGWDRDPHPLGSCIPWVHEFVGEPIQRCELGLSLERNHGQAPTGPGGPPKHPQRRRIHIFKEEGAVTGAVIGASWEASGDPYKGLRGAGEWEGGFYSLRLGGEGVIGFLGGSIRPSQGGMQGCSSACTHACSREHWAGGGWDFWPREGAGGSGLRMWGGGQTSLPRNSLRQLCLPGPRDPLPDG